MDSTNITFARAFVTFHESIIFFHIWLLHRRIGQYQHQILLYFCHIWWFYYFFHTFGGSNVTLGSTKSHVIILSLYSIVLLFFSHIRPYQHHIWLYFCWFITILVIIKMLIMNFSKKVINLKINKNTLEIKDFKK